MSRIANLCRLWIHIFVWQKWNVDYLFHRFVISLFLQSKALTWTILCTYWNYYRLYDYINTTSLSIYLIINTCVYENTKSHKMFRKFLKNRCPINSPYPWYLSCWSLPNYLYNHEIWQRIRHLALYRPEHLLLLRKYKYEYHTSLIDWNLENSSSSSMIGIHYLPLKEDPIALYLSRVLGRGRSVIGTPIHL